MTGREELLHSKPASFSGMDWQIDGVFGPKIFLWVELHYFSLDSPTGEFQMPLFHHIFNLCCLSRDKRLLSSWIRDFLLSEPKSFLITFQTREQCLFTSGCISPPGIKVLWLPGIKVLLIKGVVITLYRKSFEALLRITCLLRIKLPHI